MLTTLGRITPATLERPAYLAPLADHDFGGIIKRVCNDTNIAMPIVGGDWAADSRHHYSKDQPFSDDGRMCKLQQKGGNPSNFVVSAETWQPLFSDRDTPWLAKAHETRWRPGYASQMVSVEKNPGEIRVLVWDVLTGAVLWEGVIPTDDPNFGWAGEGQISDDGRWTVFSTRYGSPASQADYVVVVDLERGRVGPRCDVSYATRAFPTSTGGVIGNCGTSALGNYCEVKLSGVEQYGFVLDIDKDSLVASRHRMQLTGLRMGTADAQGQKGADLGCIGWLSHPDMNLDWLGREVVVGGSRGWDQANYNSNSGKLLGNVVMIDLRTGDHIHCSPGEVHLDGARAASMQHGSGRAHKRRGWHLCSMEIGNMSQWGAGEVQWIKLDGSREVERLCAHRSMETGVYRGEAHPVSSPDGSVVMFASNWMGAAGSGGIGNTDVKAYAVTQDAALPPPPPVEEGPYVWRETSFTQTHAVFDKRASANAAPVHPADLAKWANKVWKQEHP